MDFPRLNFLVQVTTLIALIVGTTLVVYELRQTSTLSRLNLSHAGMEEYAETMRTIMGENFSETLAKACSSPASLDNTELEQMYAFHMIQLRQAGYIRFMNELSGWDIDSERQVLNIFNEVAKTSIGVQHLTEFPWVRDEMRKLAMESVKNSPSSCDKPRVDA